MGSTGKEASGGGGGVGGVDGEKTTKRKPRFMCLHGFRMSGEIMKAQVLTSWPVEVTSRLDLFFPDGSFPCSGKSEAEGIFHPPYYEWFQYHKDFTEYEMILEKAMAKIEQLIIEHGPFDGLIGFSQGAILSAAIAGLQSKGLAFKSVPKLKYLVIIRGAMFQAPQVAQRVYPTKYDCISLHFLSTPSVNSSSQKGYAGIVDWQEEVYQKIKTMKELYFAALNDVYEMINRKLQQRDSSGTLKKEDHQYYEKIECFKNIVIRTLNILQLPKASIVPGLKDNLHLYEKQITNILNPYKNIFAGRPHADSLAQQRQSQAPQIQQWKDIQKNMGERLMELFVDPFVIHHPKGQTFPMLDDEKNLSIMFDFLGNIEKDLYEDGK